MYQPKQNNNTDKYRKIAIGLISVGIILALGYGATGFITTQSNSDQGISIADYQINAQVADAQVDTTDGRVDFVNITYDNVSATVENIPSGDHSINFTNTFKGVDNADADTRIKNVSSQVFEVSKPQGLNGPNTSQVVDFVEPSNPQTTDNFATNTNFTEEIGSNDTTNFTILVDATFEASVNNGSDSASLTEPVNPQLTVTSDPVVIADFTIVGQLNAQAPSGS